MLDRESTLVTDRKDREDTLRTMVTQNSIDFDENINLTHNIKLIGNHLKTNNLKIKSIANYV